ncbi:hypothetical protein [Streptomyces sp. NPDC101206]
MAEWGDEIIEAEAAWALPGGNNGADVVVTNIDAEAHPETPEAG